MHLWYGTSWHLAMHASTENLNPLKYASTKSKPLEATDIEYNPTLIADLSDQDADQRQDYYKAVTSEIGALCALGFAEVTIILEDRDGISTRFVL